MIHPERRRENLKKIEEMDRKSVMAWLEGLAQDDWRMFHSDSEVQEIARNALKLLKEQVDEIAELRSIVEFWKDKALHT